jgi:hypothetical protein
MEEIETVSADERRAHDRYAVPLAVQIEAEGRAGRVGVLKNGSAGGLLFMTRSHFRLGEKIDVTIFLPRALAALASGRVVRVTELALAYPWRFWIAAKFDAPAPILGDVLRTITRKVPAGS